MAAALAAFVRALAATGLAFGLVGLLRLGLQFPAAAESPGLLVPFLLPVLALALEAGALVALSVVTLRTLLQGELGPPLSRARSALPGLAPFVLSIALAQALPRGSERPGALANDLVERAVAGCDDGLERVAVPLLGLNARCGGEPRIEGAMPGVRSMQVAMRELRFSEDLRSVQITGLELTARRSLTVHLKAGSARITGLAPWARSSRLSPLARFGVLAAVGTALWLAACLCWGPVKSPDSGAAPRGLSRRLAVIACGAPGVVAAVCLVLADQRQTGAWAYGAAAAPALAALFGLRLALPRAPRFFGSVAGF